jgi:hypothetical protein
MKDKKLIKEMEDKIHKAKLALKKLEEIEKQIKKALKK